MASQKPPFGSRSDLVPVNPCTDEEVFRDFKGRRAGMIKALTTDAEEFYRQCDSEKGNLCLYGFPSEQWEVNLPAEEVPSMLPEPTLGIIIARDVMQVKDWLSLVAVHSDLWLLSLAFMFGARLGFDKADRECLFIMINDVPTVFEVVAGEAKKETKEKSSNSNDCSNKSKLNPKDEEVFRETIRFVSYNPRINDVFEDFKCRRAGMIKALTTDVDDFYQQCDPEKGNLCLYGFPSEQWEVSLPSENVPPQLPEPIVGINFARDGMQVKDWLSLVALHSDLWVLSVAFYYGARLLFDKADRKRLFNIINELPTIFQVVRGAAKKQTKENHSVPIDSSAQSKPNSNEPHTFEEIIRDFKGRHAGIIKALTTDADEFYRECNLEKGNLCLYGFPSEQWEVNLPAEEVPSMLPEPTLGIIIARDVMQVKDWLSLVAVHSDLWLLSLAFMFGARLGFDKADRERLFNTINDLPTVFEVVTGAAKKETKEISLVSNDRSNKSKSNPKDVEEFRETIRFVSYNPRINDVFRDFNCRRAGMIKALTIDVEDFYKQCDPEKGNLCLYGFPNEQWEVSLPSEKVPSQLPEPIVGINFARDGMQVKNWLSLIALHSDLWLLSVAFYYGARLLFDKADRKCLFGMINELPTIFEVVRGAAKKQRRQMA